MTRPAVRLHLAAQAMLFLSTSPHAANALLLPTVDSPAGGGGSVVLEPVKPRAQSTRRLVYSCVAPDLVTFSDRPCGPLPEVRELKVSAPAPTAAGASPELAKTRERAAPSRGISTGREDADPDEGETEHAATCQKLQATLDSLDSRMRTGYSAREAGRLWERWREAKVRLREANC
ncbi:MAG: hypothetical protein IPJ97_16400 [Proteobacteria bacterium]|nr:hypothetical protein [Pseudomonadota bacterium]